MASVMSLVEKERHNFQEVRTLGAVQSNLRGAAVQP